MQFLNWLELNEEQQAKALKRSPLVTNDKLALSVKEILSMVKTKGDTALVEYNQKFDNFASSDLKVSDQQIVAACESVPQELKEAIAHALDNIKTFHQAQIFKPLNVSSKGVSCELRSEPINKVGLYIPGGSAPLISTVLMLAIPAQIAKCPHRILVSPPPIDPTILYAATVCGITEIYQIGGAQAVAALGYGTQTVPKVDKIFGPGNSFVTEAKKQISNDTDAVVTVDMPAGPSEVLVIADVDANPKYVAADLLSQAEHGPDSQVILVSDSQTLIDDVQTELRLQMDKLPRKEIIEQALECSKSILVEDIEMACTVSNMYAPEHLIVQTHDPRALLSKLRSAGSIFLGPYTPESVGDYASGTNHVLPTYGYSKNVSSLSLADFCRRYTVQELDIDALTYLSKTVMTLASAESLDAHKNAVAIRMEDNNEPS